MKLDLDNICWNGLFPQANDSVDISRFAHSHDGKSVLVTGAGGSIGSALAETIHSLSPGTLVLLDSSEQNLYRIHNKFSSLTGKDRHVPILGSVADKRCLRDVFQRYHPEI